MFEKNNQLIEKFLASSKPTAVKAVQVSSMEEAVEYAISTCEEKDFCKLLLGDEASAAGSYADLPSAKEKIIAAPGLDKAIFNSLEKKAKAKNFSLITSGMRERMAGIDMTLSVAEFGIADTATCCITTQDEEYQLATMICEIHIVILPLSKLHPDPFSAAPALQKMLEQNAAYTSFISGPSRTADIERVAAFGVHGPLEMHVVIVED